MLVNDKIIVLCNTDFLEGHSLKRLVSEYRFPLESGYLCQEKLAFFRKQAVSIGNHEGFLGSRLFRNSENVDRQADSAKVARWWLHWHIVFLETPLGLFIFRIFVLLSYISLDLLGGLSNLSNGLSVIWISLCFTLLKFTRPSTSRISATKSVSISSK